MCERYYCTDSNTESQWAGRHMINDVETQRAYVDTWPAKDFVYQSRVMPLLTNDAGPCYMSGIYTYIEKAAIPRIMIDCTPVT